jgi:NAD+ diphosphatase
VALHEENDGTVHLALERADPRPDPVAAATPAVYLGHLGGLRVAAVETPEPSAELDDPGRDLRDLRHVVPLLAGEELGHALTAIAMGDWHRSTRHCPRCGALLESRWAGWMLQCSEEGTEHFPRTDPAVIMAVRDPDDRLLLARNAHFRGAFHSVLAGFVEPGESIEQTVVREVAEEVAQQVTAVQYVGSQPWPFPRSLMLGFRAWCADPAAFTLADGEIAEASWFSREDLAIALAQGEVQLPGHASIGRALIEDWYGSPLPASAEG